MPREGQTVGLNPLNYNGNFLSKLMKKIIPQICKNFRQ